LTTLIKKDLQGSTDADSPFSHIVWDNNCRPWICSPGFYEYHKFYLDDPWELLRYTEYGKITWIVERACNLIDRTKLIRL
jgi:hypothetical protein